MSANHLLKPCTLIGSDKGGVGKSLVAQLVITAYDSAYDLGVSTKVVDERTLKRLKVIEVDNQRRLSTILDNRVDLALDAAPTVSDMSRDTDAGQNYYNKIYEPWREGPSLTDLGANVTTALLDWAKHFEIAKLALEDNILFRLVTVLTPDSQALRSAFEALRKAREALGERTELFMCFNDTVGRSGYDFYEGSDLLGQMRRLADAHRITVINIPYCDSMLMEWGRAHGYTVREMIVMTKEIVATMVEANKLDRVRSRVEVRKYEEWIEKVQQQLMPLFEKPGQRQAA